MRLSPAPSLLFLVLSAGAPSLALAAQTTAPNAPVTIASRTAGMARMDGLVPLYWDEAHGALLMEVPPLRTELIYQVSLAAGLGSNPVGLDRDQLGDTRLVHFERVGPRVLLVASNTRYRALTNDDAERSAVADSFARSILWGFTVEATEGDRVLVDATAFFLRDAHGVIDRLRATEQGPYRLEPSRSAIFLPRTKAFPRNTEIEATLTFVTDGDPGTLVAGVSPDPRSLTLREHHSLVALPEPGYHPRRFDPRVNVIPLTVADYASPIDAPLEQRWMVRFRLEKKDPSAARSEAVRPIVYYVDNGAPEPIRQALVEGASWWSQAFEAAGFINAFQVKVLPADADPMDVRYNVIHWVHRSTRGWSYGGAVVDPRSGEILKGNVLLGSLRVRQNILIGSGLTGQRADGDLSSPVARACAAADMPDVSYLEDPGGPGITAMALARIRQLAAHEVGHTLGFEHNFAASSHDRASVMDYPAPLVSVHDGQIDLSRAYASGIGDYDRFAVRVAYTQFLPADDETAAVRRLVDEGIAAGQVFISDEDARSGDTMHPKASLWDNGGDAVAMLREQLEVRRIALSRLGLGALREGEPVSALEATLVPLFLHHRYQLQAALKWIGGLSFSYAINEGGRAAPADVRRVVPPDEQRRALAAVLATLDPAVLTVPKPIVDILPPTAFGYREGIAERFPSATRGFDPVAAAVVAADLAVSGLLDASRAARLEQFHAEDPAAPDFTEVVQALVAQTWGRAIPRPGLEGVVERIVARLVVTRLMDTAGGDGRADVRAIAASALRRLAQSLATRTDAHARDTRDEILRYLDRPMPPRTRPVVPQVPAGEPIG